MASKTGPLALALLFCATAPARAGQDSPLKWPVPPPGPPRAVVLPNLLVGIEGLVELLAAGALPLDAQGPGAYEREHLPGAVPAWSPAAETLGGISSVRSLLSERGITGERTVVLYGDGDREATARLFWLLRQAGCPEVRIFDGTL